MSSTLSVQNLTPWRTMRIGGKSKKCLLREVGRVADIDSWARNMMEDSTFVVLSQPTIITLAKMRVRDLGFSKAPRTNEFLDRVAGLNAFCENEVGPYLRMRYRDQPTEEELTVVSRGVRDLYSYDIYMFELERYESELVLDGECVEQAYWWHLEREIILTVRSIN